MANTNFNSLPSEAILNQLPILFVCANLQHEFLATNQNTAQLFGYKNIDQMVGDTMFNIPCEAAKASDQWKKQNKEVVDTQHILTTLDIHPYVDNNVTMLLAKKAPLWDETQNTIGISFAAIQIHQKTIFNIAMKIANSDKKYRPNKNVTQRSYSIFIPSQNRKLSTREMECLFYFVRGKSAREIAELLSLSKRTIEDHIENIKNKMECYSKSQLIEKAIDNSLIDIIPDSFFLTSGITSLI